MSKRRQSAPLPAFVSRLPAPLRFAVEIVARTADDFLEDGAPRLAAALAYYLLIALAPLLIVAVAVAGAFFARQEVRDSILGMAYNLFGDAGAVVVNQILIGIMRSNTSSATAATLLGVAVALFGASAAFGQLQAAINIVWGIRPRPEDFRHMLRRRGLAFLMVLIIGVLLVGALIFGTGLARVLGALLPSISGIGWLTEKAISFVGAAVLFAIIFTVLPDRRVDWRDTIVGAAVTSLLFNAGSVALGAYLGRSSIGSLYGAAGSIAVVLVWLYYTTQVLLFGAEFTHVWAARRRAARIERAEREEAAGRPQSEESSAEE
ncbi:MAG: YihY/virulence factor BrkB family protein [Coriobacteriia bacterium]|nr:YihY/virulence factor BrkB family protein [Coriobacteriia bacterium]